jgi:purine-binding chemotaxis protein CheW
MAPLDGVSITRNQPGMEDGQEPDGEGLPSAERTLLQRASDLARLPSTRADGDQADMLVFRLGDEQYAIEMYLLHAVQRTAGLTPVPCTPSYVAGILNVRGAILTVLDLAAALELVVAAQEAYEERVLLVDLPQGRVGLLVDEILGHRPFTLVELHPSLSSRPFMRGIAETRITVLDLEEFFAGGRFEVWEEVG